MAQSCAWSLEVLPAPYSPGGVVAVLGGEPPGVSAEGPPQPNPQRTPGLHAADPAQCGSLLYPHGQGHAIWGPASLSGEVSTAWALCLQPGLPLSYLLVNHPVAQLPAPHTLELVAGRSGLP